MLITIALIFALAVQAEASPAVSEEKLTVGIYFGNLFKFMMWNFLEMYCLLVGWVGLLLQNDNAQGYKDCKLDFINKFIMDWDLLDIKK